MAGNRAKLLWLFSLGLLILGSSAPAGRASSFKPFPLDCVPRFDLDDSQFEEGDIVLRKGRTFVSSLISLASPQDVSHCGILVRQDSLWQVIHTISGKISDQDGVRINTLDEFIAAAEDHAIIHCKPAIPVDRTALVRLSRYYLHKNAPFDHSFDLEDSSRLYCSELIRCVYMESGTGDIFSYQTIAGKRIIDMQSFFDRQYFWVSEPIQLSVKP